jgi:protein TonB
VVQTSQRSGRRKLRLGGGLVASAAWHAAIILLCLTVFNQKPQRHAAEVTKAAELSTRIVWLPEAGPGGRGGGGGNRRSEAPPKAQAIGKQAISLTTNSSHTSLQPVDESLPVQRVNIPARSLQSGAISLPGALESSELPTFSQGPGTGDGVGVGRGPGLGEGEGPGLGPGAGGNRGGRSYRPGSGITPPIASHQQRPSYTSDAVRARIQGVVLVECVVHVNGACSDVHVVRSLDTRFGLDQEAIKAARMWRFVPGTLMGQPVPVIVTIELTFGLH